MESATWNKDLSFIEIRNGKQKEWTMRIASLFSWYQFKLHLFKFVQLSLTRSNFR